VRCEGRKLLGRDESNLVVLLAVLVVLGVLVNFDGKELTEFGEVVTFVLCGVSDTIIWGILINSPNSSGGCFTRPKGFEGFEGFERCEG
jgi:hypothetical protein